MQAVTFSAHADTLDVYALAPDFPAPQPGADDVLVRVHYAALNRLDDWVRRGWKGLDLDFPHIPCSDFVGEIATCGADVQGWSPGTMVTANPLIWCDRCRACLRGEHNRCVRWNLLREDICGIIGSTMGTQDNYRRAMELVFTGRLDPVADSVFPMTAYVDALRHMMENRHFGKILIDVIGRE